MLFLHSLEHPTSIVYFLSFVQLEAPTAYLMGDFSKYHLYDPATGTVTPQPNVDNFSAEYAQPVIISTQDDQFALGAYTAEVLPDADESPGIVFF